MLSGASNIKRTSSSPTAGLRFAGLEWLQPGDNSVGSATDNKIHLPSGPAHLAILHLESETVSLNPPTGGFPPDFLVADARAKSQSLRAEANKDKVSPRLTVGTLNMYVNPSRVPLCPSHQGFSLSGHSPVFTGSSGSSPISLFASSPDGSPIPQQKRSRSATLVGTSLPISRFLVSRNSNLRD